MLDSAYFLGVAYYHFKKDLHEETKGVANIDFLRILSGYMATRDLQENENSNNPMLASRISDRQMYLDLQSQLDRYNTARKDKSYCFDIGINSSSLFK